MYVRVFSGFPNQNWKRSSHLNGSDILVCLSHSVPSRHLACFVGLSVAETVFGQVPTTIKEWGLVHSDLAGPTIFLRLERATGRLEYEAKVTLLWIAAIVGVNMAYRGAAQLGLMS